MKNTLHRAVMVTFLLLYSWLIFPSALRSQHGKEERNSSGQLRRQCITHKIEEDAIQLDGRIDEPLWNQVEWSGDFIQYQPEEGKSPYQPTQFKILHDDKYLYFAGRAFDQEPDSVTERLSRRDEFPGDWIEVNIDSYHDLRTAFSFTLSVSGVKGDEFISENGNHWDDRRNIYARLNYSGGHAHQKAIKFLNFFTLLSFLPPGPLQFSFSL